jgi:YesN/AraC family two-component response regulator
MKRIVLSLAVIIAGTVFTFVIYPQSRYVLYLVNILLAGYHIYFIIRKKSTQPPVWSTIKGLNDGKEIYAANNAIDITKSKNEKTVPANEKIGDVAKRILVLMEEEKLYQESELTLQQLAGKLSVPTYLVSQAINEGMNKNFYDLINSYRIDEAKRLLLDPKNISYTILSVGFEAGFNSKTTFNTVFKKFTGLTPTEYREKHSVIAVRA